MIYVFLTPNLLQLFRCRWSGRISASNNVARNWRWLHSYISLRWKHSSKKESDSHPTGSSCTLHCVSDRNIRIMGLLLLTAYLIFNFISYYSFMENRVFASLANGDIVVFFREKSTWNNFIVFFFKKCLKHVVHLDGVWNINEPQCITVGSLIAPVTRMLAINNGLWCATQNSIKILDTSLLSIEVNLPKTFDRSSLVILFSKIFIFRFFFTS